MQACAGSSVKRHARVSRGTQTKALTPETGRSLTRVVDSASRSADGSLHCGRLRGVEEVSRSELEALDLAE
jgi:hypothetical protein